MSDYGERKCLVCGKAFEPKLAQQVCCSTDCQKQRDRLKSQEWKKTHCSPLQARVDFCEKQIALLERLIAYIHGYKQSELEALYKQVLGEEAPKPEPAEPVLHECKRMKLKAMRLPCGERQECFKPKRCKQVPEGVEGPPAERTVRDSMDYLYKGDMQHAGL